MAYAEPEGLETTSTWLKYHLGQSTGYRELSKRLQKKATDPAQAHSRKLNQGSNSILPESYSLPPVPAAGCRSPRGSRRPRAASGSRVISAGDLFWLRRDAMNAVNAAPPTLRRTLTNLHVLGGISSVRAREQHPNNSSATVARSGSSRLLGMTRSEAPQCLSAGRRHKHVSTTYSLSGAGSEDMVLLGVGKNGGMNGNARRQPVDIQDIINDESTSKPSATQRYQDVIIKYRFGTARIEGKHSDDLAYKNSLVDAPPPSPVTHSTDHVTGAHTDAVIELPEVNSVNGMSEAPSSDGINPVTAVEEANSPSNLTVSEYFRITFDNEPTRDRKQSPNSTPTTGDVSDDGRPSTKRSVRFSVENDVYSYSPWEPINASTSEVVG